MATNDYNTIKPVESLQNVGRLSAAERRRERKHRQDTQKDKHHDPDEETEETVEEITMSDSDEDDSGHSIDYCA